MKTQEKNNNSAPVLELGSLSVGTEASRGGHLRELATALVGVLAIAAGLGGKPGQANEGGPRIDGQQGSALTETSLLGKRHQVYAPPLKYGNWQTVAEHTGERSFQIEVEPIGKTAVFGQVRYYDRETNRQTTKDFHGKITIRTGNSYANVQVRLKGVPTGSSCWVDVTP